MRGRKAKTALVGKKAESVGRGRGSREPFWVTQDSGLCSSQTPGSTRPFAGFAGQWESPGAGTELPGAVHPPPSSTATYNPLKVLLAGSPDTGTGSRSKSSKTCSSALLLQGHTTKIYKRGTQCAHRHTHTDIGVTQAHAICRGHVKTPGVCELKGL